MAKTKTRRKSSVRATPPLPIATPPVKSMIMREDFFERFHKKYLSSMPSRVAMARRDYSVGEVEKLEGYLRMAFPRPTKPPPPQPKLPHYLLTLLRTQEEDGRWSPSPTVLEALGGEDNVPDPPSEGMGGWRWVTALVLALIRREGPSYLGEEVLFEAYVRAKSLVSEGVLGAATAALPDRDTYFPLDVDMVKTGRWKECLEQTLQSMGHQPFVTQRMRESVRAQRGSMSQAGEGESVGTEAEETKAALEDPAVVERQEGLRRELRGKRMRAARKREAFRQEMLSLEYKVLSKPGRRGEGEEEGASVGTGASGGSGVRDLRALQRLWPLAIGDAQEMQRLQQMQTKVTQEAWTCI
jgi:hypothetical protein